MILALLISFWNVIIFLVFKENREVSVSPKKIKIKKWAYLFIFTGRPRQLHVRDHRMSQHQDTRDWRLFICILTESWKVKMNWNTTPMIINTGLDWTGLDWTQQSQLLINQREQSNLSKRNEITNAHCTTVSLS